MGVPLSNYTILQSLADGYEKEKAKIHSFEMEYALNALENYSVFAFILHDPTVHKDFHELLSKQFSSLHYSSGKHLVFFGLVDSPKKYCLTGNQPFYSDVRDAIELMNEKRENESDLSYSAIAMANSLRLKPEMLPAIVITHDPRLSSFKWYKSCPDQLEIQMSRLTGISNQMNYFKNFSGLTLDEKQEILYKMLDENDLDLCKGMGISELNESMARALSDILSFMIQGETDLELNKGNEREVVRISNRQSKITLERAIKSLQHLSKGIENVSIENVADSDYFQFIEDLNIKLASFLTILNKKFKNPVDTLPIRDELLEDHSLYLLKTALEVEALLQNKQYQLDYSPSAICLAKMFEKEINLSFVHWIRKQNSIRLPEYFNQVQPGVVANVKSGNQTVNLNDQNHDGTWRAPELGKSKNMAYKLSEMEWKSMGIDNSNFLKSEWNKIHRIRNEAAHTSKVTKKDLETMKTALTNLANTQIFEELATLKNHFRSTPTLY